MGSLAKTSSPTQMVLIGFVVGFILAAVVPWVVEYLFYPLPTFDRNTQAYCYIVEGLKSGQYARAKQLFDAAYSYSDDAEIRYVANFNSKACDLVISSGISTKEDAESMEGLIKNFVNGFINPMAGVSAWSLMFQQWFGDYEKDCNLLDARYGPYITAWNARQKASHFYWIVFFGTPIAFGIYSENQKK